MYQKRIYGSYYREMLIALALYCALLVVAIRFGRPMDEGVLRTLVLVSPMLGFGLMLRAIVRHIQRVDEYIRQLLLESVALSAGITAGLTFTYGFLESAGYPRLSMFSVWGVLCIVTMVVCAVRHIRER
jgi:O-antigen/teichoic acid export membrane protein